MSRITSKALWAFLFAPALIWLNGSSALGASEVDSDCGTVITPKVFEYEALRRAETSRAAPDDSTLFYLPVTVHVVRRADSTGGLSESNVTRAFENLNDHFIQVGMTFFRLQGPTGEPVTIFENHDFFYDSTNTESFFNLLRSKKRVKNTINIWFVPNTGLCGTSSFSSADVQGIIIDNLCAGSSINTSTIAHEFGHYFDLYHTHESRFGIECPDSSNCDTTGDLLCDTPADPNINGLVLPGCIYDGSATTQPPCQGSYNPQTSNLMSHSLKNCRDLFTPGQVFRMRETLINNRQNILVLSSADTDSDGIPDIVDNCPAVFNPSQMDTNLDGIGDACVFAEMGIDNQIGALPHTVNFTGVSGQNVTQWLWDFGDGSLSGEQSPTYTYLTPGNFDVTLTVLTQDTDFVDSSDRPITVVADTLFGSVVALSSSALALGGGTAEIDIIVHNNLAVSQFLIPFSWAGPFEVSLTGWSTENLRTGYFELQSFTAIDAVNRRAAIRLVSSTDGSLPPLAPGRGAILKLFFDVTGLVDDSQQITIGPFPGSDYFFVTDSGSYEPLTVNGQILLPPYVCGDADGSQTINILDITFLIGAIFAGGPQPLPSAAGDANGSGSYNIADVVYMIKRIFGGGPEPVCP